eukprot:774894-Rhodomonas_salina.5
MLLPGPVLAGSVVQDNTNGSPGKFPGVGACAVEQTCVCVQGRADLGVTLGWGALAGHLLSGVEITDETLSSLLEPPPGTRSDRIT